MKNKIVFFLGCGNMGEAVLKAFLSAGASVENVFIKEQTEERKQVLQEKYKIQFVENLDKEIDIFVLAIKPQQLTELDFSEFSITKNTLLISILAGTNLAKLSQVSSLEKCARVMPNLPLMFNKGMSTCVFSRVEKQEKELVKNVFAQSGKIFELDSESQMHEATLLAGSGPGFYFYFVELFQELAEEFGFTKEQAEDLARQTCTGSAEILSQSQDSAKNWKERVTSKGGTTEAALKSFAEQNLKSVFKKALTQGVERSKEL